MIKIPEELLEQIRRGNVLLFIGEQIVHDAEGSIFFDHLADQLAARCEIIDSETYTFPETAQAYADEKGRHALIQFIRDQIEVLGDKPQPVHRLIAGLTQCQIFVTTCIDQKLERAFNELRRPLQVIISNIDIPFEEEGKARLYKLRGSIEQVDSLGLTEDDYASFEDKATLSVVLQADLARKTILFVGYELADPHFQLLYRKVIHPLDKLARRAYAFGTVPPARVSRWCKRYSISVFEINTTDFLELLIKELNAHAPSEVTKISPEVKQVEYTLERPYKFLDYYEAKDEAIFFGRQSETQAVSSLIHAHRLVLLYGRSGVGKTSLLRAGVAPQLERTNPPYEIIYIRPLEDPVHTIRRLIQRRWPQANLPEDSSLVDCFTTLTSTLKGMPVVIFDQFEEFFMRYTPQERDNFIAQLGTLYDADDVPIKLVFSLREDWLASIDEIEKRIPHLLNARYHLMPMSHDQAREAIEIPVEKMGVNYNPKLVYQLLKDLRDNHDKMIMPTELQLVCNALYERTQTKNRQIITMTEYNDLDRTEGILSRYLNETLDHFAHQKFLAQAVLESLVSSEETRQIVPYHELTTTLKAKKAHLDEVLEKLIQARLIRRLETPEFEGGAYELAHEYLTKEITLSPEILARKEARELLRQGLDNWRRIKALLSEEVVNLIEAQRDQLQLNDEEQELLRLSIIRHTKRIGRDRLLSGLIGGALGGGIGGGIIYLLVSQNAQVRGQGLGLIEISSGGLFFGALTGGFVTLGVSFRELRGGGSRVHPAIGGAITGILPGLILGLLIGSQSEITSLLPGFLIGGLLGALYGAGLGLSITTGRRFGQKRRLLITTGMAILVGLGVGIVSSIEVFWILILSVGIGIAIGISIVDDRAPIKRVAERG